MYIKTYLATASRGQIAHVAWQRISAPFVKTVEPFALVVSLKMRDLHSLVSQVELLLSPIGVAVFLHKPNAVAVEKQRGIYPIEVRVGALCDEPFWMSSRMAL